MDLALTILQSEVVTVMLTLARTTTMNRTINNNNDIVSDFLTLVTYLEKLKSCH